MNGEYQMINFKINNVREIENVNIDFNKVTVLSGENTDEKTVMSKLLYILFDSFNIDMTEINARSIEIINKLWCGYIRSDSKLKLYVYLEAREKICNEITCLITIYFKVHIHSVKKNGIKSLELTENLENKFILDVKDIIDKYNYIEIDGVRSELYTFGDRIGSFCSDLFESIKVLTFCGNYLPALSKKFEYNYFKEFGDTKQQGEIKLCFVDGNISIQTGFFVTECCYINSNLYYIDSELLSFNTTTKTSVNEKIKLDDYVLDLDYNAYDMLKRISGESEIKNESKEKVKNLYKRIIEGLEENLSKQCNVDKSNSVSGLKFFEIIEKLINDDELKCEDIIVLDKPEFHLNSIMQMALVKIIVLLKDEFDVNIIINTQSKFIISGLEDFAKASSNDNDIIFYMVQ